MARMGELIPSWNGDGVFTGQEPYSTQNKRMNYNRNNETTPIVVKGELLHLTRYQYIQKMREERDEINKREAERLAEMLRPKTLSEIADMDPRQRALMNFGQGYKGIPRSEDERQDRRVEFIKDKLGKKEGLEAFKCVLEIIREYKTYELFEEDANAWLLREAQEDQETAMWEAMLPDKSDQTGWSTVNGEIQPPTFPESPIRYSVDCQHDLVDWINWQNRIYGCQYFLTSTPIMEELAKQRCELIIHEQDWWTNENQTKWQQETWELICDYYPLIKDEEGTGIYILPAGETGKLMHQKRLIGERILDAEFDYEYWEHNLACGSFNLTKSGNQHLESLFFIDNINSLSNSAAS